MKNTEQENLMPPAALKGEKKNTHDLLSRWEILQPRRQLQHRTNTRHTHFFHVKEEEGEGRKEGATEKKVTEKHCSLLEVCAKMKLRVITRKYSEVLGRSDDPNKASSMKIEFQHLVP